MMILGWNSQLAQRFPDADHRRCVQRREELPGFGLVPCDPPQCLDYHCSLCGRRSTVLGRHDCEQPADYCREPAPVKTDAFGVWPRCALAPGHDGAHQTSTGTTTWNDKGDRTE